MKLPPKKRTPAEKNAPELAETFPVWQARVLELIDERAASTARGWSKMLRAASRLSRPPTRSAGRRTTPAGHLSG
jgi:hypothetical protein